MNKNLVEVSTTPQINSIILYIKNYT